MGELFSDVWVWASAGGTLLCGAALPLLIKKARAAGSEPLAGSVSVPPSHVDDEDDEPIPVLKTPKTEAPAEPAPATPPAPGETPPPTPEPAAGGEPASREA